MYKIEIHAADGRELKMSKGSYVYYKPAEGQDTFWEWEKLTAIEEKFDALFEEADNLLDKAAERLPNIPMPGTR
jgi:hypothetical protein